MITLARLCVAAVLCAAIFQAAATEKPATPPQMSAERIQQFHDLQFGMLICWSFSSFSGYEWTPGVEDINFFHPTGFDPDSWVAAAKDAEMNYILFLTKHHDGFLASSSSPPSPA